MLFQHHSNYYLP